jgi:hypothetical protein
MAAFGSYLLVEQKLCLRSMTMNSPLFANQFALLGTADDHNTLRGFIFPVE